VSAGELVIVDGDEGRIIVSPDADVVRRYRSEAELHRTHATALAALPPEAQAAMFQEMAERYPNILKVATASAHQDSVVGQGCDDQFEFEFALDLLLDSFERLHRQHWSSTPAQTSPAQTTPAQTSPAQTSTPATP